MFIEDNSCEVYRIKTTGTGFIRNVTMLIKMASVDETIVYNTEIDLTNRTLLIEMASDFCNSKINTVVFRGPDKHMTFVHKPDCSVIKTIEVFDTIPPENPWLWFNIERLEKIGVFGELQLKFKLRLLDLREFEDPNAFVIFPCKVSGLNGFFLDSVSDIDYKKDIRLVGCDISKKTFEAVFSQNKLKKYKFINVCPQKQDFKRPFIVRCCQKEKSGIVTINGVKGVSVHWGATPLEIIEAVKLLASELP